MSDKKLTPEEQVSDIANGQRLFLDRHMPKDEKFQIIRIAVEAYIEEAESSKKKLLEEIKIERHKNATVKETAERLARELLDHDPEHAFAKEVLALLLENKMQGEVPEYARRKKR